MADVFAPQPVKTKTNGDLVVAIVDTAGTNKAVVSAAGALKVDPSAVTQPVTLAAGTAAIAKAEDVASADADVGVPSMAIRKGTPANTSGTDGDYEMLQMLNGRLWASANIDQIAGTTPDTNSGVKSAGTLRVVLATDQPQLTAKLLVTPDANSTVDVNRVGGTAVSSGNGVANTGCQRVTVASDNSAIPVSLGLSGTTVDSGRLTSAALAAGATVTLDSANVGASNTGKLAEATVSSSVALKAELGTWDGTTFTAKRTFFVQANTTFEYTPARNDEITLAGATTAKFRWSITNNDNANAADVYASITHSI